WYISISGPNINIGQCVTIVAEPDHRVKIAVWGREPELGKITIGDYVLLSPGCRISASDEIIIGNSVMVANGVYITDSDWHGIYDRTARTTAVTPVHIGDNVWLGDRSTVLKGVTIGENTIVAAGAVVSKNMPANVVLAGNPAKVVKHLDAEQGFTTRADYFSDPVALQEFVDGVDKAVLTKNSFFNWLRSLISPSVRD
ncbi:MAG: acyltransferase, partial [Spongiibacteraceae bacterium]|nr:acyltransferase [Spongiibacteraceae bacterium]